jgi:GTPase SAR1 family protein
MISTYDEALARMRELAKSDVAVRLQGANEAETRLLLIDRILNILGWVTEEFRPEQHTSSSGYTDYCLEIDGKPQLIVEAKRHGLIPPISRTFPQPQYKNSTLHRSCGDEMRSLLDQCRLYCSDWGLDYAIATTGNIWIILIGGNIRVEWGDLLAFVFHSLDDIVNRFNLFYDLISREAVKRGGLDRHFSSMRLVKPGAAVRPRSAIDSMAEVKPLPHRRGVRMFFDVFMDDITSPGREDMLTHCYVDDTEIAEFSRELRALLEYDAVLDEQEETIPEVDVQELQREIDDQWDSDTPKTILLVGRIGAGKSTFVHKFIREQALPKKHICILVNLIDQATVNIKQTRDEEQHISKLILDQLFERFRSRFDPYDPSVLRACFRTEVEQFRTRRQELFQRKQEEYLLAEEAYLNILCEDKFKHLTGYIKFIRNKKYKIWVTLDNIDQGSYAYQEFIYNFAHRLSNDARCVTLITLREDTFLEAQDAGFLNVRRSDIVFRLNAPELKRVIAQRRRYVNYVLNQGALPRSLSKYQHLVWLINDHMKNLLLGNDDTIRKFITSISLGNTRYSLQLLHDYYISPYAPVHQAYDPSKEMDSGGDIENDTATVERPDESINLARELEHFIQSLMLKHDWSYDERDSDIFNIFAVDAEERRSHFIALVILAYLTRESVSPKSSVKISKLCADLLSFGYQKHQVVEVVKRMLPASLLLSPKMPIGVFKRQDIPDVNDETRVSISAKGYYYLNHLCGHPYYQSRVAEDTIWYDEEAALLYTVALQESHENQEKHQLRDALMSTDARVLFQDYLSFSWIQEYQSSRVRVQSEWARVVHMVEERVFGRQLTQAVVIVDNEPATVTQQPGIGRGKSPRTTRIIKAAKAPQHKQLSIFPGSSIDYKKAVGDAIQSLGPMPNGAKVHKSTYLLRVLWAMEVAVRCGLTSISASDIARIINEYGGGKVAAPNVAKFFRGQRRSGEFTHLWSETETGFIAINHAGRELLLTHMSRS